MIRTQQNSKGIQRNSTVFNEIKQNLREFDGIQQNSTEFTKNLKYFNSSTLQKNKTIQRSYLEFTGPPIHLFDFVLFHYFVLFHFNLFYFILFRFLLS